MVLVINIKTNSYNLENIGYITPKQEGGWS